jgi:hypothetical protein
VVLSYGMGWDSSSIQGRRLTDRAIRDFDLDDLTRGHSDDRWRARRLATGRRAVVRAELERRAVQAAFRSSPTITA